MLQTKRDSCSNYQRMVLKKCGCKKMLPDYAESLESVNFTAQYGKILHAAYPAIAQHKKFYVEPNFVWRK